MPCITAVFSSAMSITLFTGDADLVVVGQDVKGERAAKAVELDAVGDRVVQAPVAGIANLDARVKAAQCPSTLGGAEDDGGVTILFLGVVRQPLHERAGECPGDIVAVGAAAAVFVGTLGEMVPFAVAGGGLRGVTAADDHVGHAGENAAGEADVRTEVVDLPGDLIAAPGIDLLTGIQTRPVDVSPVRAGCGGIVAIRRRTQGGFFPSPPDAGFGNAGDFLGHGS